jgi:hypothetical protein
VCAADGQINSRHAAVRSFVHSQYELKFYELAERTRPKFHSKNACGARYFRKEGILLSVMKILSHLFLICGGFWSFHLSIYCHCQEIESLFDRECPARQSIVRLGGNAGIGDREAYMRMGLQLAGYLCAYVSVPRPCKFLSPVHNNNTQLNCNLTWGDFYEVNPNIMLTEASLFKLNITRSVSTALFKKSLNQPFALFLSASTVWTSSKEMHMLVNHDLLRRNKYDLNFNNFTVSLKYSELIEKHVQAIMTAHSFTAMSNQYTTLHIRRGDSIHSCNSSPEHVDQAIQNVYQNWSISDRRNHTILFFSDEINERYRRSVLDLIRERGLMALDCDRVVAEYIQQFLPPLYSNNYFIFAFLRKIQTYTIYSLTFRRCHGLSTPYIVSPALLLRTVSTGTTS